MQTEVSDIAEWPHWCQGDACHRMADQLRATRSAMYAAAVSGAGLGRLSQALGFAPVTGRPDRDYLDDEDLWRRTVAPDDTPELAARVAAVVSGQGPVTFEHRIRHADETVRWVRHTLLLRRGSGGGDEICGVLADITAVRQLEDERQRLLEELSRQSLVDTLTGLLNRRGFDREIRRIWNLAEREHRPCGLLVLDLDHFKTMNDVYGHLVGDQILREASALLQAGLRGADLICRYGGDEIVILLPMTSVSETRAIAERLLGAFRAFIFCAETHHLKLTISIGAAAGSSEQWHTPARLLAAADRALYSAKRQGRDRLCFAGECGGDPTPAAPADNGVPPPAADVRGRVLIVDDEPLVCGLFERMLRREGYHTWTANTLADAVTLAREASGTLDVALVDLMLGPDNGLDLVRRIAEIDNTVVSIVVTGQANMGTAVDSLRSGAYDFIAKPMELGVARLALDRAMKYRRLLAERRQEQAMLEDKVAQQGVALKQALAQMRQSYHAMLQMLAAVIDARERRTGEHSLRVARIAAILARTVGIVGEAAEAIEHGALLHDVGKVAMPDAILLKPGALTEDERLVMQTHPQRGYDMIAHSPQLRGAARIVLEHQERYDGKGYPRGLQGEAICDGARLFAVADAYDAIRATRAYSRGRGPEAALAEIRRHSGTQFDPVMVEALARAQAEIEAACQWPAAATA